MSWGPDGAAPTVRPDPSLGTGVLPRDPAYLGLPVILHLGQVLGEVPHGGPHLWVLGVGEVGELSDELISLVPQPSRLAGVGGQQRAELAEVLLGIGHSVLHHPHLAVPGEDGA